MLPDWSHFHLNPVLMKGSKKNRETTQVKFGMVFSVGIKSAERIWPPEL